MIKSVFKIHVMVQYLYCIKIIILHNLLFNITLYMYKVDAQNNEKKRRMV